MALTFAQDHTLTQLEHRLQKLDEVNNTIDDKAKNNIQSISIILGIIAAFNWLNINRTPENQPILIIIFALYALSVVLCFYVLLPKRWLSPISPFLPNVRRISDLADRAYYLTMIEAYTEAIALNQSVARLKSRIVGVSTFLIGMDVLLILFLAVKG